MSYAGPLIDAHHHLWDIGLNKHPWIVPQPGKEMVFGDPTPLYRNYLPADLKADAGNWNLVGSVHIEAGWIHDDPVGETRWLTELAEHDELPSAMVVHAPLHDPAVERILADHSAFERVRGLRYILSWHRNPAKSFMPRPDIMAEPQWLEGFKLLKKYGLSFDLMIFPSQAQMAAKLAADHPDTLIILNHCGSPVDRDAAGMAEWAAGLKTLAARPNVHIKISDLVAYDHDWTLDSLRRVTLTCIDAFGADRAIFASDFPVAKLHASWDEVFGSFDQITADFTDDERADLFCRNAARDYRIALEGAGGTTR